jgi:pyruvate formate lyase activating enzyme
MGIHMSKTGFVFNIQRFSIHDGPGIRTAVFLKGCPLHCYWCHNPEGIKPKQEIQFFPSRCILCGECVLACEQGAHALIDGIHRYDRTLCIQSGRCVEKCVAGALEMTGRQLTVDQVISEIIPDIPFYEESGGGVTISGGEPLLQFDFTYAIMEKCKEKKIHTAIETSAFSSWDKLARLLAVTDLVIMDIKHMNPEKHREATGVSNHRILENARLLAQTDKPIIFHTPIVPDFNDTPQEIAEIAKFIHELVVLRSSEKKDPLSISLVLLPFHRLASDKYESLGLSNLASELVAPSLEKMSHLVNVAREFGIEVKC